MVATGVFVGALTICTVAWFFGAIIGGGDLLDDAFGDIEEPTGLLSGIEFVLDLAVGLGKVFFGILTFDVGLPVEWRFVLTTICGTIIVLTAISVLTGVFN